MPSSSVHWGSSAVSFTRNVAHIVASVAVAVVGLAAIYYVGNAVAPTLTTDVINSLNSFWQELPNYWDKGVEFFKGLWSNLTGPGGLINNGVDFAKTQWNTNPWVKGGTIAAGVGVGAYVVGSTIDKANSWRGKVGGSSASSDASYEMKELARRLRAQQAERGA